MKEMKNKVLAYSSVLNAFLLVVVLAGMDNSIPLQYDAEGNVAQYGSKWIYLLFAVIPLLATFGYHFFAQYKRANDKSFKPKESFERKTIPTIVTMFVAFGWIFMLQSQHYNSSDMVNARSYITSIIVGAFIMYVSNYISGIQVNEGSGEKMFWIFRNETVLRKSKVFLAYSGVSGGFALTMFAVLGAIYSMPFFVSIGVVSCCFLCAVLPMAYALLVSARQDPNNPKV